MNKFRRFLPYLLLIYVLSAACGTKDHLNNLMLWAAAYGGDTERVRSLLAAGANVNFIHERSGWTPLMAAANEGHLDTVRVLLENEADVNTKDEDGYTALALALSCGNADIVHALLDRGADVEYVYLQGRLTPLISAVINQDEDIVKALLVKGANINAPGHKGTTPLMMAASGNFCKIAKLLLDKGADVNAKRPDGATALSMAREKGFDEMVNLLLEGGAKE